MVCLYCGSKTKVCNSRLQRRNNQIWRRRQCRRCQAIFTTHEGVDLSTTLLVQRQKALPQPFSTDKLFTELLLALQDRKDYYQDAREVTNTVVKYLLKTTERPLFTPAQISQVAGDVLKRLDRRAWLRYVADHPSLQA